ncbi:hypothetical protein E2C01_071541 [Portunus trituberculatus]|uniref:Uncharacterized protein n=1 Tax=Portunus trituberculatus TaxID=210409 RepID=A0A5B7I570_PORTR|nr:hypothetical protein [Portunus trituberculatus]
MLSQHSLPVPSLPQVRRERGGNFKRHTKPLECVLVCMSGASGNMGAISRRGQKLDTFIRGQEQETPGAAGRAP